MENKYALLARVEAKPEKADQVEQFLNDAVNIAADESGTNTWFALKFDDTHFGIFDTFSDEGGRNAHLNGEIADALMSKADELFTSEPTIEKIDLIASTVTG